MTLNRLISQFTFLQSFVQPRIVCHSHTVVDLNHVETLVSGGENDLPPVSVMPRSNIPGYMMPGLYF